MAFHLSFTLQKSSGRGCAETRYEAWNLHFIETRLHVTQLVVRAGSTDTLY
jgi:hypothetical protein